MNTENNDTNDTVMGTFTGLPKRKLNELLGGGWRINGVSIEREEGGVTKRGAVTTGGMVLWWNQEQPAQREPVPDALYFAQWTAAKKDLSDYICVGSLTLAGIEDGEYGQSEINSLENTIEALQEKLVTGADHKKVPLLAYIGALNSTPPQPAQRKPLTDDPKNTERPQSRAHLFPAEQVEAVKAQLQEAVEAHGLTAKPEPTGKCSICGGSDPAITDLCREDACGMREGT